MPDHCFCEGVRAGAIRQPSNTVSSFAFVLAAVLVLRDARNASAWRFAGATLLVGLGSAWFHATLSFWGQTADVLGMYVVATFLLIESLARRSMWTASRQNALFIGGNTVLLAMLIALPDVRRYVFALLVVAIIASEWRRLSRTRTAEDANHVARARRAFTSSVALLAFGFAVWILDITRVVCAPTSLWQLHALWHLCGAASAWCAYRAVMGREPPRRA